jgi:Glycosyltransferase family 87
VTLLAVKIVNTTDYHNNDFFTFWLAGRLVLQGGNPYSPYQWVAGHHEFGVTWIPNQAYVYPLPLSLLFVPLGSLSLKQAYIAWVAITELMILAALALLLFTRPRSQSVKFFVPLLVGIIFFRPTILTLFNGQISGLLLLLLAGTAFLWEKGKWELGSLLMPFLMLKPNIGAPVLVFIGLWLLFQKRYKSILVIAAGLLVLLVIGLLQNHRWVMDYWAIGNAKVTETFGGSPTVWGLGALISHNQSTGTLLVGSLAALLILFGFFYSAIRSRAILGPLDMLALVVTVTLLVTPYTWTYDQLLLVLPLTAVTFAMDRMGARFPLTATFFLGLDALILVLLFFDTVLGLEILNVIIPVIVLGLLLWMTKPRLPAMV